MEKNYYLHINTSKGFAMINGALTDVKLVKETNVYNTDSIDEIRHELIVENNGKQFTILAEDFYRSVEDFEKGTHFAAEERTHFTVGNAVFEEGFLKYWIFSNGEPKEITEIPERISFDYSTFRFSFSEVEFECWKTRQDCLDHNTVKIVDANGNETEHVGIAKLVALTDEQKQAIEQVRNAIKSAEDLGVKFAFNTEDDMLICFNKQNISGWTWESDGELITGFTTEITGISGFNYDFPIRIYRK